ncbi:MAG: hypothetical protein KDK30_02790 [Leptospiraceae bacterium]|nr:hypothetical protein [Leptospiraceae bacterium]
MRVISQSITLNKMPVSIIGQATGDIEDGQKSDPQKVGFTKENGEEKKEAIRRNRTQSKAEEIRIKFFKSARQTCQKEGRRYQ